MWLQSFLLGASEGLGAQALGLQLILVAATTENEFEAAFATVLDSQVMALIIGQFSFLANNDDKIRAFVARYKIPIVYPTTGDARAGGLTVMQVIKLDLVINLKTAKAHGIQIPRKLLVLVDEVIE